MPTHETAETLRYYQLRPAMLERFAGRTRGWPKRDQFCSFFREVKRYRGQVERSWKPLTEGKPVPAIIARAFVEYLRERLGSDDATLESLFVASVPPPEEGVWESPHTIAHALTEHFSDRDEMYLHNPVKDTLLAARMIFHSFGHKLAAPGEALDDASCFRRAEEGAGRSLEDYARWLREIAAGDEAFRCVMFVVSGGVRIGACVILPLREKVFERLCSGKLNLYSLKASDLDTRAGHLFLNGLSDSEAFPSIPARERSLAQAHTMFYQMAYFTRRLRPCRPRMATIITNAHYRERLARHGFVETGACMPDTSHPVTLLRHPRESGDRSVKALLAYKLLTLPMTLYRIANHAEWRQEDVLRKRARTDPVP